MVRMGRYFKAPSSQARQQWIKIELLYRLGERFWAGNSGLGRSCPNLRSTVEYLAKQGHSANEIRWHLVQIRRIRLDK